LAALLTKDLRMNTIFDAAMRKAAKLTSRQNLVEATRVIQDAIAGKGNGAGNETPNDAGKKGASSPDESSVKGTLALDFKSDVKSPGAFGAPWEEASAAGHGLFPRDASAFADRMVRPIGEVLELLRHGAPSFGFGVRPQPLVKPEVSTPDGALFLTRSFNCEAGARDYKLYIPSDADGRKLPLVVMLHGCKQDPDDFAIGTGMNQLGEDRGFIVAYPKQSNNANPSGCWNWFNPKDQMRDSGEPSIIAGITRSIMAEFDIDPDRVYVAGLSAGGAMAAIMAEAYPDLFAAAGIHSGLPYGAASDVPSAFAAMRGGANPAAASRHTEASVRTIVFHGALDRTVNPANAELIVAAARAGLDRANEETQEGELGGAPYARTIIKDARGAARVEYWEIGGLGHAWSGGNSDGSFTEPDGPDASREMLRFFLDSRARRR
jgi:poly(hydroxyalkanoate) depolymerase family esterase